MGDLTLRAFTDSIMPLIVRLDSDNEATPIIAAERNVGPRTSQKTFNFGKHAYLTSIHQRQAHCHKPLDFG